MHGLGNDYLYVYGELPHPEEAARKLSNRHFGVGSDGIILITPSEVADFKMRIFNADGSEANMCGNGIRCVGKYVFDKGYTEKTHLTIETLSGVRTVDLKTVVVDATVDMGKAEVQAPVALTAAGVEVTCTPVSVGNPHAVIFVPDAEHAPLTTVGAEVERHKLFPGGVNVEFVEVIDRRTLRMRVWERGSGITMACGTGACASVAAAVAAGYCDENEEVAVRLDGGDLQVKVRADGTVMMTGPAKTVCECDVDLE